MRFIDSHCHVHDPAFDADRDATLDRARDAGVEVSVTLGSTLADSRAAVALAERRPDVLAAAGVHPHDAAGASDADLDALEELAQHPRVALVGEIGLDFYRNLSPRDVQIAVLRRQLHSAQRLGKPVAVHSRDAETEMRPLLAEHSFELGRALADGRPLGVMHYFSSDIGAALTYVELGFLISIHTSVTHPMAQQLADVARELPLEHMVLETDSPYGSPQRHRGKRNEPAYVVEAAARVAELKGIEVEEVAETTTRNAHRLLGLTVATGRPAAAGRRP